MKLREKLATVIAYARKNGGRLGSSAMLSHHATALQAHTTPYSRKIGTNSHPVRTVSARRCPTPIRATRYAKTAEPQTNSSSCSLRLTRRPGSRPWRRCGRRVSRKLQLLLFVCGSAVFAYLVARIGVGHLLADTVRTGWLFVPIFLLYGVVCACNAGAWWLSMADEPSRPPFWRAYAITVASLSLNFMTPMVNVGGEPFKIAAVAPWLGLRRAAGSVVIYQILHTLGMLLSFLTAVMLGALLLPRNPAILTSLALAFVVLAGLVLLLLTGHRRGGLERLLDLLHRIPLLGRLARRLEPKRATLAQMDEQITEFYHRRPRRFVQAVALEYLSRSIFMIEYVLIAMGVGVNITFAQAYVIGGLTSLVQNVIFFVPFEVGTKEGSLYLVFDLLGLDPALGVYTAIVSRVRDLAWIGGGLALVWFSGRRAQERAAAP